MNEYLPLPTLLRLLAVFALVLAPHVVQLPLWASLFIGGVVSWRGLAAYRQWRMPATALKLALTVLAFGGVIASFGRILGQNGGTALLCVMGTLKLLEFRGRRDVMVMIFLMYFVLVTHFLVSQEIWTLAYLLVCVLAVTATLIECQHRGALSPRATLRKSASMVLQALPLMLLLFVLFPRIPGPLWGLPADAGAARSGLGDSMSPGDISRLTQSDAISFRVEFEGTPPPVKQRYWRGPVFDRYDGRRWSTTWPSLRGRAAPHIVLRGQPVDYTITLEPQRVQWLLALDFPDPGQLPSNAFLGSEGQLLSDKPVGERRQYRLRSYPDAALDIDANPRVLARNRRLPRDIDPRARALAAEWRAQGLSNTEIVDAALRRFRDQPYVYTLNPPVLGDNAIDEFLFETRRGYCEHYAGAFTFLMRAAGIPARVVSGYLGGEHNPYGDYEVVRQSDAHAWSEVWLEGRGWVRVDPTSAIAPGRVEDDVANVLAGSYQRREGLGWRARMLTEVQARWEWINGRWNGLVLAYGPELQQRFLQRFGLDDLRNMILALTIGVTLLLALVGALQLRRTRTRGPSDPALLAWQRVAARLARAGIRQAPSEGPLDFAARVARDYPQYAQATARLAELYTESRYLDYSDPGRLAALRTAARGFRPMRR